MIDSFECLNIIFDICANDKELCDLLKIDSKLTGTDLLKAQNDKLRREYQTADVIKSEDAPFISYYFLHAEKVKTNWLVNKGDLVVDIYAQSMYEAGMICRRFRKLIADSKMEILLNYEGQHYSGVVGVYKYRLIYNPLIDGE